MRFQRANYLVSNKDRALLLYRDILGMNLDFMKESEEDSYSYDVFAIDESVPMQFALLSYENQPRVLALTILGDGNLDQNPTPRRAGIVIEVDNVDAITEKCRESDFKCFRDDHLITHDGREGKEVGILDDDGNLTVIYKIETA
jgi:catechol 2,3-dioxygenase-like lactoylglutathione lyase family enzyme